MKRGLRQSMPSVPIPAADTSGRPPASQVQPVGTIRETCSCGASVEVPSDHNAVHRTANWRSGHRHTPGEGSHQADCSCCGGLNDRSAHAQDQSHVTTGEIRDNETQDVPFGFFPPVVEAGQS